MENSAFAPNICFLTYNTLTDLVHEVVSSIHDDSVRIFCMECHHNSLFDCVIRAREMGAEVFIAGGSNLKIFRQHFSYPILGLEPNFSDYILRLSESVQPGDCVAIVSYMQNQSFDFSVTERLLQIEIKQIVYEDSTQLAALLEASGCPIVMGAAFVCSIAESLGKKTILTYTGREPIVKAIYQAQELAFELRKKQSQSQLLSVIIDNLPDAVLSVDQNGDIIMFNPAAEHMLGIPATLARGSNIDQLLPELEMGGILFREHDFEPNSIITCRDKNFHVWRSLIPGDPGGAMGIAILTDLYRLQDAKQNYLNKYNGESEKHNGFVAKHTFRDIVGESASIRSVIQQAEIYAGSNSSVFILGETGTGKELIAQGIHRASLRRQGRFVAVNCAAIPESLLESELFGYAAGAFTDSRRNGKAGMFELADHGTLFLDEVGDLSPAMQVKLLRALQEREIIRVGSERVTPVDIRIIAASNKSREDILSNGFRPDLFYRLDVFGIDMPPLRARGDDVILIFRKLLRSYIDEYKIPKRISDEDLKLLTHYSWPGNVRELENVCQRFCLFFSRTSPDDKNTVRSLLRSCIGEQVLFNDILAHYQFTTGSANQDPLFREMIAVIKDTFGYSNEYLATRLGISRTTLWRLSQKETPSER